ALKKYVKGADFKNIKFETLENQIEIKYGKIIIPNMEIRSTAMNLYASGTHTFTNEIDYKIKMQLSEVLGRKVKNLNTEFGIIEEDGLGKPNIFVSMKGPIANPVVKYDRKAVESHIAQSAKQEKQNLKVILNKEFGLFKKDSTVIKANTTPERKKKKQELIIDTDPF
ncbi:MAG TPA: AsmA-like C-terminal region-containing protein, partial [Bacteroidia bacterium]|nr:AsmA-like C-terminal region-containing protein [Bacteroidia bacterium]